MLKWELWLSAVFVVSVCAPSNLQTGLGMRMKRNEEIRPKRRPSETADDRQMVTIDLSALRPSLPGLVLYKYGEQAPKLVQVDLSALNPLLQPHVIWPQFDQMELIEERPMDFDNLDAIPYLSDDDSLMSPKAQRLAKMTAEPIWSEMQDITDGDIYDFIPDSRRNDELMSLHGSLPLADEVIVPLDWEEEKTSRNSEKRNVFSSAGWKAGGDKDHENETVNPEKAQRNTKGSRNSLNTHYSPFGSTNWMHGKSEQSDRETESEENKEDVSKQNKKNVFTSSGWGPGGRQMDITGHRTQNQRREDEKDDDQPVRISSQESWSVPRQYWNVPHLIGNHWQ